MMSRHIQCSGFQADCMCNHQLRLIQHMTHISKSPSINLCSTADRIVNLVKPALHQHECQWRACVELFVLHTWDQVQQRPEYSTVCVERTYTQPSTGGWQPLAARCCRCCTTTHLTVLSVRICPPSVSPMECSPTCWSARPA